MGARNKAQRKARKYQLQYQIKGQPKGEKKHGRCSTDASMHHGPYKEFTFLRKHFFPTNSHIRGGDFLIG